MVRWLRAFASQNSSKKHHGLRNSIFFGCGQRGRPESFWVEKNNVACVGTLISSEFLACSMDVYIYSFD